MAINTKEFINKVDTGLKADADYKRFYFRFKKEGKIVHGVIDYSNKSWDKRTRVAKAKAELADKRDKTTAGGVDISDSSTLDKVAKLYFDTHLSYTSWHSELRREYNKYIGDAGVYPQEQGRELPQYNPPYKIGRMKIRDIKQLHIDNIRKGMETKGFSKQNANGCSFRTIKKVLKQTLEPIFKYAYENGIIDKIPAIKLPVKKQSTKKKITNATEKLSALYRTIMELYADDPFYRALFLFALYGRRLNEVLTLEWRDIDFDNSIYRIREENYKTGEEMVFDLPRPVAEALMQIESDRNGLVFKSPKTGRKLHTPKKQLAKVKSRSGVDDLTFHKFRHILVSAMAESGMVSSVLSASLGHSTSQTTEQFYITQNHLKATSEANKKIEEIIS